jgi:Rieske Fe-S protein
VKDRFTTDAKDVADVPRGEGRLVRVEGQQLAVYRDEQDTVHMLSPVCTHMHCIVQWNMAEKTWDCPCHGGRFLHRRSAGGAARKGFGQTRNSRQRPIAQKSRYCLIKWLKEQSLPCHYRKAGAPPAQEAIPNRNGFFMKYKVL